MRLVSLPFGPGWHFVSVDDIAAVKYSGPKKTTIILNGGAALECSEDTHVIHRRIEDFIKSAGQKP